MRSKGTAQQGAVEDPVVWYVQDCEHRYSCADCLQFEGSVHHSAQLILGWAEAIYQLASGGIEGSFRCPAAGVEGLAVSIAKLTRDLIDGTVSPEIASRTPEPARAATS